MKGCKNARLRPDHNRWNLRGLFGRWIGRAVDSQCKGRFVKVWDAQRDAYRNVNLYDRNDPQWEAAWSIACNEYRRSRRSAA